MPPFRRRHELIPNETKEEVAMHGMDQLNDMPPLVDLEPSAHGTYTFLSFDPSSSSSSTAFSVIPDAPPTHSADDLAIDRTDTAAAPHIDFEQPKQPFPRKSQDPSYFRRSPNAFILFRVSFIKEHKFLERVEGDSCNLSKIIGMYWKSLSETERAVWYAKEEEAKLANRLNNPDWRFIPAVNTRNGRRRGRVRAKSKEREKEPPDWGSVSRGRRYGGRSREAQGETQEDADADEDEDEDDSNHVYLEGDDDSDYSDSAQTKKKKGKGKAKAKRNFRTTPKSSTSARSKTTTSRGRTTTPRTRPPTYGQRLYFNYRSSASSSTPIHTPTPKATLRTSVMRFEEAKIARFEKMAELLAMGKRDEEFETSLEAWEAGEEWGSGGVHVQVQESEDVDGDEEKHVPSCLPISYDEVARPPSLLNPAHISSPTYSPDLHIIPSFPRSPSLVSPTLSMSHYAPTPPLSPVIDHQSHQDHRSTFVRSRSAPPRGIGVSLGHGLGRGGSMPQVYGNEEVRYGNGLGAHGVVGRRHRFSASASTSFGSAMGVGSGVGIGSTSRGVQSDGHDNRPVPSPTAGAHYAQHQLPLRREIFSPLLAQPLAPMSFMPRTQSMSLPRPAYRHGYEYAGMSTPVPEAQQRSHLISFPSGDLVHSPSQSHRQIPIQLATPAGEYPSIAFAHDLHNHHAAPPLRSAPTPLQHQNPTWWPSHSASQSSVGSNPTMVVHHQEPERHGSFEQPYQLYDSDTTNSADQGPHDAISGESYSTGTEYGEMSRRYLQVFPHIHMHAPPGEEHDLWENQAVQGQRHDNFSDTIAPSSPIYKDTQERDMSAGSIFRTRAPSTSTFSSLTGWDGSAGGNVLAEVERFNVINCSTLDGNSEGEGSNAVQNPWSSWAGGEVQSVGLGGGDRWNLERGGGQGQGG